LIKYYLLAVSEAVVVVGTAGEETTLTLLREASRSVPAVLSIVLTVVSAVLNEVLSLFIVVEKAVVAVLTGTAVVVLVVVVVVVVPPVLIVVVGITSSITF
jgi:hypothetical protein